MQSRTLVRTLAAAVCAVVTASSILIGPVATATAAPAVPAVDEPVVHSGDIADEVAPGQEEAPDTPWSDQWENEPEDLAQHQSRSAAATVPINQGGGISSQYSYQEFQVFGDALELSVNVGTGNLFARSKVISLAGAGVAASSSVVYNSNSNVVGDVATWRTDVNALGISGSGTTRIFNDGTGARYQLSLVNNVWQSPPGLKATFRLTASGSELTYNDTSEKITFNATGFPLTRTDRNGVGITYGYSSGRLASITDANGKSIGISYGQGLVTSIKDGTNRDGTFTYSQSRLSRLDIDGYAPIDLGYQSDGLLASIQLADKRADITYSGRRVKSIKLTRAGEPEILTQFAYAAGSTNVIDPRGHTSTFAIDGSFRVIGATDQLGRIREQQWSPSGDITSSTSGFTGSGSGPVTERGYDSLGNQNRISIPTGASTQAIYAQGSSCTGAQVNHPSLAKCTIDDAGNTQSYSYDNAGNLTRRSNTSTSGKNESVTYLYETNGSLCGGKPGQICRATDANNRSSFYTYANGLIKTASAPHGGASTFGYDAIGRVISVGVGSRATTYSYDAADRVTKTTYSDGSTFVTSYSPDGLILKETDSQVGVSIENKYDLNGFLKMQELTKTTQHALAQTSSYEHDKNGNLTRFVSTFNGIDTAFSYDDANQMKEMELAGGDCSLPTRPKCFSYEYDEAGSEVGRVLPGGARQDTQRDDAGRPVRITAKDAAGVVQSDIGYSYESSSDTMSIQSRTSYKEQGIPAGAITTYSYDSMSRLTGAVEKIGSTTNASWAYAYDGANNRTSQTRSGKTGLPAGHNNTFTYTYNGNKLMTASENGATWSYDADGNQRLNGTNNHTYTYGVQGEVTGIGSGGVINFGQGNNIQTREFNSYLGISALGVHAYGTDKSVYRNHEGTAVGYRQGGDEGYFTVDHLGSTVAVFSGTGAFVGGYSYSPYGENRFSGTSGIAGSNPIKYLGAYYDSGRYKLGARYYEPQFGRFTQPDPSGQEQNPYTYAGGDPINASDYSGLLSGETAFKACAEGALVGAGIAVGTGTAITGVAILGQAALGCVTGIGAEYVAELIGVPVGALDYIELLWELGSVLRRLL